ncbi:MAG: hypothetical protein ACYSTY_01840 [Planctomycetota bacterium]|jgi:hypothetical protein
MSSAVTVSVISVILLGMAVVLGVLLIVCSRSRWTGYPSCGRCGYDVSGSVGFVTRCPECGCNFTEVGILPPRRTRNPFMIGAGVALIVLATGCFSSSLLLARAQTVSAQGARKAATAAQQATGEDESSEELTTEAQSSTEEGKD